MTSSTTSNDNSFKNLNLQNTTPSFQTPSKDEIKPLKLSDNQEANISKIPVDKSLSKTENQGLPLVGPHAETPKASETNHKNYSVLKEEPKNSSSLDVKNPKPNPPSFLKKIGQAFRNAFSSKSSDVDKNQKENKASSSSFSKKPVTEGRALYREMTSEITFLKQSEREELLQFCKKSKSEKETSLEIPSFIDERLSTDNLSKNDKIILQKLKSDCETAKSSHAVINSKYEIVKNLENLKNLPENEKSMATTTLASFNVTTLNTENFAENYEKVKLLNTKIQSDPNSSPEAKQAISKLKSSIENFGEKTLQDEIQKGSPDLKELFFNIETLIRNDEKLSIESQLNILNQSKKDPELILTTNQTIKDGSLYYQLTEGIDFLNSSERGELFNFCNALNQKGNPHPPKIPAFIDTFLNDPTKNIEQKNCIAQLKKDCEFARAPFVLIEIKNEIFDNFPEILKDLPPDKHEDAELALTNLAKFDPHNVTADTYLQNLQVVFELSGKIDTLTRHLPPDQKTANRKSIDKLNQAMENIGDQILENELHKGSRELGELHRNMTSLAGPQVKMPIQHQIAIINEANKDPSLLKKLNGAVETLQTEKLARLEKIKNGEPLENNQPLFLAINDIDGNNPRLTKPKDYLLAVSGCFANSQFLTDTFVVVRDLIGSDDQNLATTGKRYLENKAISLESSENRDNPKSELMKDGYLILNQYGLGCKVDWKASGEDEPGFSLGVKMSTAFQKPDLTFSEVSAKTITMEMDKELFPEKLDVKTKTGIIKLLKKYCGESTPPSKTLSSDWIEAKKELRTIPMQLRSSISTDKAFWQHVDSSKQEAPSLDLDSVNANYEKLVGPLVQFALDANNEINKTFALAG